MRTAPEEFDAWLKAEEGARFEFKEAKTNFHFDRLVQYAAAIANEGGGKIILGVSDKKPRRVVGTAAFDSVERTKQGLIESLRLRTDVEEFSHPNGRVVIVHVPARPLGMPIHDKGTYWMRSGDALVPMAQDMLKRIFEETGPDFSAAICPGATMSDLDNAAIEDFRQRWMRHCGNGALAAMPVEQMLSDAELVTGAQVGRKPGRTAGGDHAAENSGSAKPAQPAHRRGVCSLRPDRAFRPGNQSDVRAKYQAEQTPAGFHRLG